MSNVAEISRLRVATFNVQHGASESDPHHGNPELVAEACRKLNVDILGLQEVESGVPRSKKANLAEMAAEASGMNFIFAKSRTYRGMGQCGNALLVRGNINETKVLKLRGDYEKIKIAGRVFKPWPHMRNAIIANIEVAGHELSVGVTHTGGDKRKQQLSYVAASLACYPNPQILLGDFNLGLADTVSCVSPYGFEVVKGPLTSESWKPRQQIDHVALNGLQVCTIDTHPRFPISDHLALVTEVQLQDT